MKLLDAQKCWLESGVAFVSFSLPNLGEVRTMVGGAFCMETPLSEDPYFVFAPFDNRQHDLFCFSPAFDFIGNSVPQEAQQLASQGRFTPADLPEEASKEQYLDQANRLIHSMQERMVEKVVLSRIITIPLEQASLPIIFETMCLKYPAAFVYLISDGQGLYWLGASPELLLDHHSGLSKTVALAGTQRIGTASVDDLVWGKKEIEEQAMVSTFIQSVLEENNVENPSVSGPETARAGGVAHLKTHFSWNDTFDSAMKIARQLHPTPAVCGLPRVEALSHINATELHKRVYYTGYLGVVIPQKQINLYVNLRCMQHIGQTACIYVGGGLTASSVAGNEWEETRAKAETLLHVFPK